MMNQIWCGPTSQPVGFCMRNHLYLSENIKVSKDLFGKHLVEAGSINVCWINATQMRKTILVLHPQHWMLNYFFQNDLFNHYCQMTELLREMFLNIHQGPSLQQTF